AMGMTGRLAAQWGEANTNYLASQRRATDVSGSIGSISKILRLMLQSGVLAVGAYLVIYQMATPGIIIAGSILSARALVPVDSAIANWRGFIGARQSWRSEERRVGEEGRCRRGSDGIARKGGCDYVCP